MVRPDVVLFGEALPEAPFARFEAELARGFDLVVSIGTSALFPYVARPVLVARSEGVPTVEINPDTTDLSDVVDVHLRRPHGPRSRRSGRRTGSGCRARTRIGR